MYRTKDISNRKFGLLTVLHRVKNAPRNKARWLCRCICGKEKEVNGGHLRSGATKSCGSCFQLNALAGKVFGELKVLGYAGLKQYKGIKRSMWECICSCGKIVVVSAQNLKNGTKSCGCSRLLHKNDIVGSRFGKLLVLKWSGADKKKNSLYECLCDCGKTTIVSRYKLKSGSTKSCGCLKTRTGPENPHWDSRLDENWRLEQKVRRYMPKYRIWVKSVFEKDNFVCQACLKSGLKMHAHHRDAWSLKKEKRYDIENGTTLCVKCHRKLHKTYGFKTSKQQTDIFIEESRRQVLI